MEAGRTLDALVGRKVMGLDPSIVDGDMQVFTWRRHFLMAGDYFFITDEGTDELPHYSTDIAAAWTIIEYFYKAGWGAGAEMDGHTGCRASVGQFTSEADTAPHAICLAALKAVGAL